MTEVPSAYHQPVLLDAVLERLAPTAGELHLDATVGPGGHSREILTALDSRGGLIGIDRDPEALELARPRLEATQLPFELFCGVYSDLYRFLQESQLFQGRALDGVLLDLGVSSLQLDRPARGFSFLRDGPLDMRMSPDDPESAATFLRRVPVSELRQVLREYGEERAAARVAHAIDRARRREPLRSTAQLARIVESVLPRRGKKTHPATRTFQAIRIAVNGELEHLRRTLRDLDRVVKPGGRVVVLSYHSLEDRIVKSILGEHVRQGLYQWIEPNPLRPDSVEVQANPRSRSAKLRAAVRSGGA